MPMVHIQAANEFNDMKAATVDIVGNVWVPRSALLVVPRRCPGSSVIIEMEAPAIITYECARSAGRRMWSSTEVAMSAHVPPNATTP